MKPTSAEHAHLMWEQLRSRGGMRVAVHSLHDGDLVTVTGTGMCNGVIHRFDPVSGVVENAGWVGDHFEFRVRCQEWTTLPHQFWLNPVVTFERETLVDKVTKY